VNIDEVIADIVMLVRPEAMRHDVTIQTALEPDLPFVTGDRVQLQQVFLNLLMNAIEALRDFDGERQIMISACRDARDHLIVAVSDSGAGLPSNTDEIFSAFFTTKPDGAGMGLAISRSIVESHGGRLWAKTDRGATFCFTLPVALPCTA
jgi:signal transduction histidine kinase